MEEFLAKVREYYAKTVAWIRAFNVRRVLDEIRSMNWIELGHDIRHWVQRNRNNVLIALGVVAALIVGLVWYANTREQKNDEAANTLHNGLNSYNRALQARDLTPEERRNELSKALQIFQYTLNQYPGTAMYSDAVFYLGNALYASGNYNEAAQRFQEYLKKYPKRYLAPYAVESVGYCHEQLGDLAKASEFYNKVRQLYPDSSIAGRVSLNLGRLAEMQGNLKAAVENYQSVVNTSPNTAWGRQARLRLAFLEAKFQHFSPQQAQPAAR
jgi:TolA-binding protein